MTILPYYPSSVCLPVYDQRYYSYRKMLQDRFGGPIRKISLDAGFSCPNREREGKGGCIYCNNTMFAPSVFHNKAHTEQNNCECFERALVPVDVLVRQMTNGIRRSARRYPDAQYIAYFQPYTNTYAHVDRLEDYYTAVLSIPGVVGISVGTRPDCVSPEILDLFESLAARAYVQIEYGLQSASDDTLRMIQRGHTVADFDAAMSVTRGRGIEICGHMITGLPGESKTQMLATAEHMVRAGISGIKIHNLHVVANTPLAVYYQEQNNGKPHAFPEINILSMDKHVSIVCDILERLPESINIQRLWGCVPRGDLIAPEWCMDGNRISRAIGEELERRGSRQGEYV